VISGASRFYDNIEMMIGFRINRWLWICWMVLTPLITVGIFLFMWVKFEPLKYNNTYVYPGWAQGLGMCMAFASMICIPAYFVIKFIITPGTLKERWQILTTPILPDRTSEGVEIAMEDADL
jgi:solute carrier family 6 GABA transporter-like protein 6/8/11/12/13